MATLQAKQAKEASYLLQSATTESKNICLKHIHDILALKKAAILEANQLDCQVTPFDIGSSTASRIW